jgi:hypothetical protein
MEYIILSLKHSTKKKPVFWRADGSGYTECPFVAGHYTEEQVKEHSHYYNDGRSTIAIPLTDAAMYNIGFEVTIDFDAVDLFYKTMSLKTKKS